MPIIFCRFLLPAACRFTPTFFINGARIEGAVPIDFIFHMIDAALLAEGKTPPPSQPGQHGQ
jgi:hypothetical protein